jgi:cold shock CspA family protein
MITPSFGLTATERVLPRLALDWTTGLPQAGVDVVRAGVATFVGSNGFIQAATENTQRVDYSSGIANFLVEETRTNLCVNSEDFTLWANAGVTITAAATDAPTGTLVAQKIAATSSGVAERYIQQSFTASAAAYTFSISIQPAETQFITIRSSGGGISDARTGIDVVNKTFTRNSAAINAGATVNFFNEANGFTRIELTITFTAATTSNFRLWLNTSLNNSSSVDMTAGDGLYYFGAGVELGSFGTSYIPTGATAVTRNADVATMTGTNFSDWFNASAGTFFINTNARNADVLLTAGTYTLSADATALKKYATTYTADPSATELAIGKGSIQKILYYKQALIAAELAALVA